MPSYSKQKSTLCARTLYKNVACVYIYIFFVVLHADEQSRRWLGHLCRMWEIRAKLPLCPRERDPLVPPFTRRDYLSCVFQLPWAVGAHWQLLQNSQLLHGSGRRKQVSVHVRPERHIIMLGK